MTLKINKITIKNFKSIKNVTLNIDNLTVMVGRNGSGKTNIIEAINFNKSLFKSEPMKYPFTKWWGYSNLVYNHNIGEPISFSFDITVKKYKLYYEYDILDNNGIPNFISEHIVIDNYVDILRKGSIIEIKHLNNAIQKLSETDIARDLAEQWHTDKEEILKQIKQTQYINDISSSQSIITPWNRTGLSFALSDIVISTSNSNKNGFPSDSVIKNSVTIISPSLKVSKDENNDFYQGLADFVFNNIKRYQFIYSI